MFEIQYAPGGSKITCKKNLFVFAGNKNDGARDYFQNILKNHVDGRSIGMAYFRSRGFRDDIIEKFQLGYCTESHDALAQEALKKGYKKDYLVRPASATRRTTTDCETASGGASSFRYTLSPARWWLLGDVCLPAPPKASR